MCLKCWVARETLYSGISLWKILSNVSYYKITAKTHSYTRGVRDRIPLLDLESGWLPKFNCDLPVSSYICGKIYMKVQSNCDWSALAVSLSVQLLITLSRDTSQIVEKCPISQCRRILLKIPGSGSGSRWLPKFSQFFLVHRHICDKIFVKIRSVVFFVKLLTDRQTNEEHYITSLAEVIGK